MTAEEEHASLQTPFFKLDFSGRDVIIIILFAAMVSGLAYLTWEGQQRQVDALNNLATEQRFTTCVLWIIADHQTPPVVLDERLLRQKCWWIRRDNTPTQLHEEGVLPWA